MSWRNTIESVMAGWPTEERQRVITELKDDNDLAEELGFKCILDDRLGYGRCYYTQRDIRVWHSADGWCRARNVGMEGAYTDHKYYHTLGMALKDENPRATRNRYGQLRVLQAATAK